MRKHCSQECQHFRRVAGTIDQFGSARSGPELGPLTLKFRTRRAPSRALFCRITVRESRHPPVTPPSHGALQRSHLQKQLRTTRVNHLPHEILWPSDGSFRDDKSCYQHNREPVVDSARFPAVRVLNPLTRSSIGAATLKSSPRHDHLIACSE